ncbi:MAG: oxaloacetate-decarboxylating malate dehydrogenase [Candidatus Riflebacteria bacterium]|nr:oxaloacetate-decarboxylating malate dehydrogenase [Candidatus Riflebacteria bacterium]
MKAFYESYNALQSNLEKNRFLYDLYHRDLESFYKFVFPQMRELLPIIYTPTVGDAVIEYSHHEICSPTKRGLIINCTEADKIGALLSRHTNTTDIAVVTDGEGVLGIGDQGIGAINIAIGKLMVYTLCGSVNPHRTLPIMLDMGTNNEKHLADPAYKGLRQKRISGEAYYKFMDTFVNAFKKHLPNTLLHFEDFGRDNARPILDKYRTFHQSFNDDIQGTGVVALAAVKSGISKTDMPSEQHKICIYGAGTAGCGIADQISRAFAREENRPVEEVRKRFFLIDKKGLLLTSDKDLLSFQRPFAQDETIIAKLNKSAGGAWSLKDVVKYLQPTILIGCSTHKDAFTDEILQEMYSYCKRPVIMPISNPTSKAEATPDRILKCTEGNALIATGSPFPNISQCNNALVFPGIGLAMVASKARCLSDDMLLSAGKTLAAEAASNQFSHQLLPNFDKVIELSYKIASAVIRAAINEGLCDLRKSETDEKLQSHIWTLPE